MEMLKTQIPFNIRLRDLSCKGEITGERLGSNNVFNVSLTTGDQFTISAVPDREIGRFMWIADRNDNLLRLVPILGRLIEKHHSKAS